MRRLLLCVVVLGCEVETRLEIVGCAVVHTEEGRACVLPIHETGFECPPDMPHRTERQGQLICSEAPLEEAQVDDVLDRLHLPEEGEMTLDGSPDPKPDASLPEDAEVDAQAPEPPDLPVEAAGTAWSCGAGAEASAQHGTCIPAAPRSCQGGAAVGCAALCEADCVVEPSIGPGTRGCRGCQRSPEQGTPNVECSPEAGACDGIEVPGDCHDLIAGFCDGLPFDIEDQPEGALFVVPGAAPGGVGTLQSPFADLGVALAAARPGDLVLLDRGLHVVEHLRVPPGVEVRGPCPVISSLRGDLTLAEGSRLEGLALEGLLQVEEGASVELALLTGPRATLGDGASLTGDRLWQMQLGGSGRALECSLCELTLAEDLRLESATLDRVEVSGRLHASSVEITRATLDGLQSEDTHVEVACIRGDVELRGPVQLSDAQLAGGLVVEADESAVVLRRLVLEGEGTFELGGSNLLDLAWVWARDRRLRLNGHADPADITGGLGRLLLRDMVGEAILANPTAFAHALVERTEVDEFEMRGNELDVHEVSVRGLANLHAGVTRVSDLHVLGALYLRGTEMDVSGLTVLPREAAVARNDGLDAQIITYRWSRAVFGRTRLTNLAIQGELTFERRTDVALELRQSFAEGLSVRDTAFEDIVEGVTLEDVELGALDLDPATQLELRRVRIDGAGEVGLRRTGSLDASGLHISGFETALELAGARARLEHVRLQGLVAMRLEAEEGGETPHLSGEDLHLEGEATGLHVRAGEVELRGLHALSPSGGVAVHLESGELDLTGVRLRGSGTGLLTEGGVLEVDDLQDGDCELEADGPLIEVLGGEATARRVASQRRRPHHLRVLGRLDVVDAILDGCGRGRLAWAGDGAQLSLRQMRGSAAQVGLWAEGAWISAAGVLLEGVELGLAARSGGDVFVDEAAILGARVGLGLSEARLEAQHLWVHGAQTGLLVEGEAEVSGRPRITDTQTVYTECQGCLADPAAEEEE